MEEMLRWIYLAVFVLSTIAFIVFLVLSAKSWRVLHILAVLFVFASAATFGAFFGLVTKGHTAWKERIHENEEAAQRAEAQARAILYGDATPADAAPEFSTDSLLGLQGQMTREVFGRGRIWRGAMVAIQDDFSVVVTLPAPEADADGNTPAQAPIPNKSPLFIFSEGPLQLSEDAEPMAVPAEFVGEFLVSNSTPNQVQATPIVHVIPEAAKGSQFQVVVYEKMPGDRHDVLVQVDEETMNPGEIRQAIAQQVFGMLSRDSLKTQLQAKAADRAAALGVPVADLDSPEFNQELDREIELLIDRYQFDGKTVGEISAIIEQLPNRISSEFDIRPEEEWLEVEFLTDHTIEVDAPNTGDDASDVRRSVTSQGFYDNKGLAISSDLRLGAPVEFKAGDTVIIDRITAEDGYLDENDNTISSLVRDGIVKVNERYFRRTLNDYQILFENQDRISRQLAQSITRELERTQKLAAAIQRTEEQITMRESETIRLNNDIASLQNDIDLAQDHVTKLSSLLVARQAKINALFLETQTLAQQKAAIESELLEQINSQETSLVQ